MFGSDHSHTTSVTWTLATRLVDGIIRNG